MKNIPVFSTDNGVGSLILREIPYKGIAYVRIESTQTPKEFVEECIQFCRMAGAEHIYAFGHGYLEQFPLHTAIWRMTCPRQNIPETDAALFPVTEKTVTQWLEIYNKKMFSVANAAFKTPQDGKTLLDNGNGYFVHRDGKLLGIGIAENDTVDAVIAVEKGAGQTVMQALCGCLQSEVICLDVASVNIPAVKLYERMGFIKTAERSRWYQLL